jgi:putative nucleotidyltransferase with HDIG domain
MGLFSNLFPFGRGPHRSRIAASIRPKAPDLGTLLRRPRVVNGSALVLGGGLVLALILSWGRADPHLWVGEIATTSLVNQVEFSVPDATATLQRREEARAGAEKFYVANGPVLERLRGLIQGLPVATREIVSLEGLNPDLRDQFDLDDADLSALQRYATTDGATLAWKEATDRFIELLWSLEPLLDSQAFQVFATTPQRRVIPPGSNAMGVADAVEVTRAIDLDPAKLDTRVREDLMQLARRAGFARTVAGVVVAPILGDPAPTVLFDEAATTAAADRAAGAVPEQVVKYDRGEVVFARGDIITAETVALARLTSTNAAAHAAATGWPLRFVGWTVISLMICGLLAGHAVIFYPRIARSTGRLAAMMGLIAGCTALAAILAIEFPRLHIFGATLSIALLSIVLSLAYDRRIAIFAGMLASISVGIATSAPVVFTIGLVAISAALALQLGEISNRGSFVRASVVSSLGALVAIGAASLVITPLFQDGALRQVIGDALLAGAATVTAGFIMLGIMPTLERGFDITTGLTLAELRDPRQPLLRELQSRAPGTYNHSLAVATIAEHAAEEIGADARLVYVGGLYHDIGKINKPEYFIENQGGGNNKHSKLSPAMSLLVIVGHVKDGLELAREYGLPRVLRHFIESHHGTTLVEYFFHAARERAASEGGDVEEFEYRYPGPKPASREAAILMIADGIESAARTMSDPTPSSIEALVRKMSRRRLDDGQLDDSPLTFRELHVVENSMIKSLCAIYHSRIAYPSHEEPAASEPARLASS